MAFELPEAVTVARQMHAVLAGKQIEHLHLSEACASLIRQGFINLHTTNLYGLTVCRVTSQGKWIQTWLSLEAVSEAQTVLLFALESGGKILYHAPGETPPEVYHVRIDFTDGSRLSVRILGWGFAQALPPDQLEVVAYPGKLGISPVDPTFTYPAFCALLEASSAKILKALFIDQRTIAGIGNGYLQDVLFRAGLHPKRKASALSEEERQALYQAIQGTVQQAIRQGGSAQEVDLYDHLGGYPRLIGGRSKDQPCPVCGGTISKIAVTGSSCYVCPNCQK